ncbi:MAG TPA: cellulase family glycosylhydrolase [Xanthobacteraceae bacterium]|nr:cellulase family glycosylhydrolase [Xanthobacteraceae bacterium]
MIGRLLLGLVLLTQCVVAGAAQHSPSVFSARRGVNLIAFVGSQEREGSAGTVTTYNPNPALCSDTLAGQLQRSGIDFVRLVATPLPLMDSAVDARLAAVDTLMECGDRLRAHGIAVIFDMHFWSPDGEERQMDILTREPHRGRFRAALTLLAGELARRPRDTVALELLNEPPRCDGTTPADWLPVQRELVAELRRTAPDLPLVVTACIGQVDGLLALNAEPFFDDPGLIYSFHFYEPFVFTHQFVWGNTKIDNLPYPSVGTLKPGPLEEAMERIEAAPGDADKKRMIARDVEKYLRTGYGAANIERRFAQVAGWAGGHGIPADRIFLGEFGASIGFSLDGTPPEVRASEVRWIHDVRSAAEKQGFKYAYWIFPRVDSYAYDPASGFLKPEFIEALGLRRPEPPAAP